ncbi:MAG: hypothetical protein ABSF80_02125 [Chitinispirillaceae bacterium]
MFKIDLYLHLVVWKNTIDHAALLKLQLCCAIFYFVNYRKSAWTMTIPEIPPIFSAPINERRCFTVLHGRCWSRMTARLFTALLEKRGLTLVHQFDSWGENERFNLSTLS